MNCGQEMICVSCKKLISHGKQLQCSICKNVYHYLCLNIPTVYYLEQQIILKSTWHCPICENQTTFSKELLTLPHHIVKAIGEQIQQEHSYTEDCYILPRNINRPKNFEILRTETIKLEQISQLLDTKLDEKFEMIKNFIMSEIKNTVLTEVPKVLHKFIEKCNIIYQEQININSSLKIITDKLENLELEQIKLEYEIKAMNTQHENNEKKLVIYGFDDIFMETNIKLERMIIYAFQESLNINLTGQIEKIYRLGLRGSRKPIYLELATKRLTKFILGQIQTLKRQGLYVCEYLDKKSLEKKRQHKDDIYWKNSPTSTNNNKKPEDETQPS